MSTQATSEIVKRFSAPLQFSMAENPLGLTEMTLGTTQSDVVVLTGRNPLGQFTLRCGVGRWHAGCEEFFIGIAEKPGDPAAGMAALQTDGTLCLRVQQLCGPASATLEVTVSGDKLMVKGIMNASFGPPELPVLTGTLVRGTVC